MQKIVKILEKNVEWLAVALGAGFLGWMIYLYAFESGRAGSGVATGDVGAG
jgi:uncharacterized membrane protein